MPRDTERTRALVDAFWRRRQEGVRFPLELADQVSLEEACHVQLGILEHLCRQGERHVGWKVGLTARAIQEQFGVHEPVFGYLLASGLVRSGATLVANDWPGPGFENEICLRIGRRLAGPGVDRSAAAAAIDAAAPAMELIETRGDFTRHLALAIADNVQQRAFVLGDAVPAGALPDLATVTVEVWRDGEHLVHGSGGAVLGHPLDSVAWLANRLAGFGLALEPGQYVMAGSLTRQFPLPPGSHARAEFSPLGTVEVTLR